MEEAREEQSLINSCTALPTRLGFLKASAHAGVTALDSEASCRQKEEGMAWRAEGENPRAWPVWGLGWGVSLWESQPTDQRHPRVGGDRFPLGLQPDGDSVITAFNLMINCLKKIRNK